MLLWSLLSTAAIYFQALYRGGEVNKVEPVRQQEGQASSGYSFTKVKIVIFVNTSSSSRDFGPAVFSLGQGGYNIFDFGSGFAELFELFS